mmetsp:Transcript_14180/g.16145  ORF Transcript_14180/g.16145 Transcript_14180/m.16145 type:complete len:90 (-) Transcript_14180:466-735(-)
MRYVRYHDHIQNCIETSLGIQRAASRAKGVLVFGWLLAIFAYCVGVPLALFRPEYLYVLVKMFAFLALIANTAFCIFLSLKTVSCDLIP